MGDTCSGMSPEPGVRGRCHHRRQRKRQLDLDLHSSLIHSFELLRPLIHSFGSIHCRGGTASGNALFTTRVQGVGSRTGQWKTRPSTRRRNRCGHSCSSRSAPHVPGQSALSRSVLRPPLLVSRYEEKQPRMPAGTHVMACHLSPLPFAQHSV